MAAIPLVESIDGISMPAILYGTAWKKARTTDYVIQAVQAGFRGIDTACQPKHYHEAGVGDALKVLAEQGICRDQLYLQTKFTPLDGQDPDNLPYDASLPLVEQLRQSFEVSCRNLGTEYIDSLILHSPIQPFKQMLELWQAMEALKWSGQVGQVGISNCYSLPLLQAITAEMKLKPALVQNRFYAKTGYDRELRAWCQQQGILYQSFWTLTANQHALAALALGRLAEKYQCEPTQILLRYVTQSGIVPLTGTTSELHMRADLDMFSFHLQEVEMEQVKAALYQSA